MRYLLCLFLISSCNYQLTPHYLYNSNSVRVLSATRFREAHDKVFTLTDTSAVYSYIHQATGKLVTLQFDTSNINMGQNADFVNYFLHVPSGETLYEFNVWFRGDKIVDGKVYTNFEVTMFKVTRKVKSI